MKIEAKNVDDYLSKTGERESQLRELDQIIRKTVPKLDRTLFAGMSYTMIGYGVFHYKSKSGREGDWPLVALAAQKNYISVYLCAAKDGKYVPELYQDKLGKVSVGRSCIRFKKLEDLNMDVLKEALLKTVEYKPAF